MGSRRVAAVLTTFALLLGVSPAAASGTSLGSGTSADLGLSAPDDLLDPPDIDLEGPADLVTDAPTVDPNLLEDLERSGSATAVVTTWDRDDLAQIVDLEVTGSELRSLPMLLVPDLTLDQLGTLGAHPAVRSVWSNETFDLAMEDTTWIVRARDAWGTYGEDGLDQTGFTGDGVEIAIIDTGADGRHADFGNLVEFCETRQAITEDTGTVLCSPFDPDTGNAGPAGPTGDPRQDAVEDFHHGTHVAGTIAGTGEASGGRDALHSTIGIAPDAKLRSYGANFGPTLATHQTRAAGR